MNVQWPQSHLVTSVTDRLRSYQDVHVWRMELDRITGLAGFADLDTAAELLTAAERRRAEGIQLIRDRERYVLSRFALRGVLAAYTGVSARTVRLARENNGRPYLTVPSGPVTVDFNLSHSDDLALIAVARGRRVGVDVERIRHLESASLAARVFTEAEADAVLSLGPAEQGPAFFRYWTCKEAYLKARGVGLSGLPGPEVVFGDRGPRMVDRDRDFQEWTVTELRAAPDYSAALVVRGGSASVSTFTWTPSPYGLTLAGITV